ncbi:MAG TPA: EpsG family protein [Solimonas sp.]
MLAAFFAVFLVLFAGSRFEVGCDYHGYALRFQSLDMQLSGLEMLGVGEGGFHALSLALKSMGYSYSALLFACALIYLACLLRFTRVLDRPLSFLALMFPVLIVQLGMSGVRQALAVGFLMLGFAAFVRRKRLAMAAWVLVAMQFHTSAVIFLPLVYLIGREISIRRMVLALAVIGPVAGWLLGERIEVYSDRYIEQIYGENSSSGAWLRYVLVVIPFILFEWKRAQFKQVYPQLYSLLRVFALITFTMALVGMVSSVALHRLTFYVMPVSIIAFVCLGQVVEGARSRRTVKWLPFLVYGGYTAVWALGSRHASMCYDPYQSWLLQ